MRPISKLRIVIAGVLCAAGGWAIAPELRADPPQSAEELLEQIEVLDKGDSGRNSKSVAAAAIPMSNLPAATRKDVERLIDSADMFRRLPTLRFEVEPAVYSYFLAHPDVAVSIWQAMKVSNLQMREVSPAKYHVDGGDGTVGDMQVLYRDGSHQLIVCDGEFKSPIVKRTIQARALMHLVTSAERTRDGRLLVTHRLDLFVGFPSQAFGTAVKLASPVSNMIIDRNFREVSLFVQMMALAMVRQPDWVEGLAGRLEGVSEQNKDELVRLTAHVFLAHQERMQSQRENRPIPVEVVPMTTGPKVASAEEPTSAMK
jgi:hypothetical protein